MKLLHLVDTNISTVPAWIEDSWQQLVKVAITMSPLKAFPMSLLTLESLNRSRFALQSTRKCS